MPGFKYLEGNRVTEARDKLDCGLEFWLDVGELFQGSINAKDPGSLLGRGLRQEFFFFGGILSFCYPWVEGHRGKLRD
jgi:hypothetical protein